MFCEFAAGEKQSMFLVCKPRVDLLLGQDPLVGHQREEAAEVDGIREPDRCAWMHMPEKAAERRVSQEWRAGGRGGRGVVKE